MIIKNSVNYSLIALVLLAFAGTAAAQGPTATLEMNANIETAVQLVIVKNTVGAVVVGTVDAFSLDLGDVNGLGLGTPKAGVTVAVNATGAVYTTPIDLKPTFSGFTTETATITLTQGGSGDENLMIEGATATGTAIVDGADILTGLASDSLSTRYVGFSIPRAQPAGALVASLIYEVTVE